MKAEMTGPGGGEPRPRIICLCGSTRFSHEMMITQWELTKAGNIVLSWCVLPDDYFVGEDKAHIGDQEGVKEIVDEVHKRKIDLSDEIFVINPGGYIGESTTSEIRYAQDHGKIIGWLEPPSRDEMLRILGMRIGKITWLPPTSRKEEG